MRPEIAPAAQQPAAAGSASRLVHGRTATTNLALFPDFMFVGPQRTGSFWLYENLRWHPQIFVERKEIYYFNVLDQPAHRKFRSAELNWYLAHFRQQPLDWLKKTLHAALKHRERYAPIRRGEGTASYAAMRREYIAEILALRPDIRIIIMVRDPVARAWSHAYKDLVQRPRRRVEDVPTAEFEKFFRGPYQLACGSYMQIIDTWTALLRPGHLHIAWFADIRQRPVPMMQDIYRFLDVRDDAKYVGAGAEEIINPAARSGPPEPCLRILRDLFAPEIERLTTRYGRAG